MCQINAGNDICNFEHLFLCFRPAGVEYMQPFFHVCETYKKNNEFKAAAITYV